MLERIKAMLFGRHHRVNPDPINTQVNIALQKNEQAGERTRQALEQYKMTDTLKQITRQM